MCIVLLYYNPSLSSRPSAPSYNLSYFHSFVFAFFLALLFRHGKSHFSFLSLLPAHSHHLPELLTRARSRITDLFIPLIDRYQKTSEALSGVTEKTTSLFGGLGGSLAKKLGDVKSSNAFKSFEERVGTTIGSVKVRIKTSDCVDLSLSAASCSLICICYGRRRIELFFIELPTLTLKLGFWGKGKRERHSH